MRTRKKSSFDEGELLEVVSASADRVEPGCQHFGLCGGCSLQHLSADAQILFKQGQMLESLQRIGKVEPEVVAPPLCGPQWAYRRRARLGVKDVPAKGRVLVGFRERGNPFIAMLERCEVLQAPVNDMLMSLSDLVGQLSIRNKVPQIELAAGDNAIGMVLRIMAPLTARDRELLIQWSRDNSVWFYLQTGGLDTVEPLLEDTPELTFKLDDGALELAFNPTDFLQVNGELNERMVQQAMNWLAPSASDRVLELFCGLGNFSLPLARRAAQVTAVEGEAGLVARAQANAVRNNVTNVDFHVADLFEDQSKAEWLKRSYDVALIDPPRAGAEAAIGWLASAGVARILYVSCHPATLARDAELLVHKYGYRLSKAGVLDMFPHTQHVESMALFERDV
jgi:23S rRNA (uracil1939-C5)-methyltransferase